MDDSSNKFIYTSHRVTKYPSSHLMTAGWYLDCSSGFVPTLEEALHQTLIQTALIEMIDLEEPKEPYEQPSLQKESDNAEKGTKGKNAAKDKKDKQGSASATKASQANISTHSAT